MRRIVRIVAIVVLLALVAGGIAMWSLLGDRERVTRLLVVMLREKLALELTLGEPAEVALWPRPGVRLAGVTVGAASAATADVPIATAREITVAVPWATLFAGDVSIAGLTVDSPEIHGAALSSWLAAYSGVDEGPPEAWRWPSIATPVRVANGRYIPAEGAPIEAIDVELSALTVDTPMHAELRFTRAEKRWSISLDAIPKDSFPGPQLEQIDARVGAADDSDLRVRGTVELISATRWGAELGVDGTPAPRELLPAALGFDAKQGVSGRVAGFRQGTIYRIVLEGKFGGRSIGADVTGDVDVSAPLSVMLDTLARTARGNATIDRLDVSGVELQGIRLEATPDEKPDAD
jgi:hypothetical protein